MANVRPLIAGGSSERGREGLCPWFPPRHIPDGMEGGRGHRDGSPVPCSSASSGPRCMMWRSLIGVSMDILGWQVRGCKMGPTSSVLGSQRSILPGLCW